MLFMKSLAGSFLLLFPSVVFGQAGTEVPKVLFKAAPQNFSVNTFKAGVEVFNKKKVKSITLFVYARLDRNPDTGPYYYYDEYYRGLGGEAIYKKYISAIQDYTTRKNRTFQQGIYWGGYVQGAAYSNSGNYYYHQYRNNQITTTIVDVYESIGNWGTGFVIGIQRVVWNVLYFDLFVGGGMQWSDVIRRETPPVSNSQYYAYRDITSPSYQGIMPKFGLHIGLPIY
jgi:hypothetical protein